MSFRGPLPRYFHAAINDLRHERLHLPGVLRSTSFSADKLSLDEVEDIHLPLSVAEAVLEATTTTGARVLDPFAGYGTTLLACENLKREGVGVELLPEHVRIAKKRAPRSTLVEGDAHGLRHLVEGPFDLCFTAPPFRTKNSHPIDPLSGYERSGGDYESYLRALTGIVHQINTLLRPGGLLVVNSANIRFESQTTTLAWDIADAFDRVIPFISESVIIWDEIPHDFTSDYLLLFRKPDVS